MTRDVGRVEDSPVGMARALVSRVVWARVRVPSGSECGGFVVLVVESEGEGVVGGWRDEGGMRPVGDR